MYWYTLYWWLFGESPSYALATTWGSIVFNWYNLQTENIITNKITVDNYPAVEYQDYNIPRWDWMGFLSKFYRSRNIEITWFLRHNTELDLQNLIDTFKKNLSQTSGIFKYITNWEYRQIKATTINLNIPKEHYNITITPFTITLRTLESFFYLLENITVTDSSSVSPRTIQVTNEWTAITQPICYLTFSGVSWTTSVSYTLNDRSLTYTWTITTWDILTLDSQNKQLLLNWVVVEYTWTFPELQLDVNTLVFTINWTFSCDYIISYRKNFI